jgi:hypothetical protein
MKPTEKQILKNQKIILESLSHLLDNEELEMRLGIESGKTSILINSTTQEEPCCEMPDYALNKDGEEKE